jgi:hypothetical protein
MTNASIRNQVICEVSTKPDRSDTVRRTSWSQSTLGQIGLPTSYTEEDLSAV